MSFNQTKGFKAIPIKSWKTAASDWKIKVLQHLKPSTWSKRIYIIPPARHLKHNINLLDKNSPWDLVKQ
jgi:hypothetical protein